MSNTENRNILVTGKPTGLNNAIAGVFTDHGDRCFIVSDEQNDEAGVTLTVLVPEDQAVMRPVPGMFSFPDTGEVIKWINDHYGAIGAIVANAFQSRQPGSFGEMDEKEFYRSVETNTWPLAGLTRQIREITGAFPRYVLSIEQAEEEKEKPYDHATKQLNRVMVKYLNYHFYSQGVIFNVLQTEDLSDASADKLYRNAKTIFVFTSGMMDAVRGQTIPVGNVS